MTKKPVHIPFNKVSQAGRELEYVRDAVESGQVGGDGRYGKRCERLLEEILGAPRVLLTTSCTHALEMAALLLEIAPGDEVIMPSFTFVSTANAFVLRGARPVFVDIRPDTLNLDEGAVAEAIGPRTRCLVPVHYAGVGCEMDALAQLAEKHDLALVEDNAHGLFGGYRGRRLGTFGCLATQSFHATKNFTSGEGGALVVNDPSLAARAEVLREKGTNRSQFFRGEVDKYRWVDCGSSYVASEMLAAYLLAQLEERAAIQAARQRIWQRYHERLEGWAQDLGALRPNVPEHCDQAFHMYYLIMPTPKLRNALIEHLRGLGILAVFHYVPLHDSPMGRKVARALPCPVTDSISGRLVRLPFFNELSTAEQDSVIEAIRRFR